MHKDDHIERAGSKRLQKVRAAIDGGEHLKEGDIAPLREHAEEWFAVLWIGSRCADMERAIFPKVHVGIVLRQDPLVRLAILGIQPDRQGLEGGGPVCHSCEIRALQIGFALPLPVCFRNQGVIQGAVFIRVPDVEHPAFERLCDLDKEQRLIERYPDGPGLIEHYLLLLRGQKLHRGSLGDLPLFGLIMLERDQQRALHVALEREHFEHLGHAVVQLPGLCREHGVVIGIPCLTLDLRLQGVQVRLGRLALRAAIRQDRLNPLHLLGIGEVPTEGNGFNGVQRADRAVVDRLDEDPHGTALLQPCRIILVFVVSLAGIEGGVDDRQQDINERILHTVKLVSDEADQMQMTIVLPTPGDLKDAGFEYGVSIVPEPFGGEIQCRQHGEEGGMEPTEGAPIVQRRTDLRGACRLGDRLQQGEFEPLALRGRLFVGRRFFEEGIEEGS